jgi:hypothetical protein
MPNLLDAIANLIKNAVPTLDNSKGGWWKLMVIVFAIALAGSIYKAVDKVESIDLKDFKGRRPEHDCPVIDGVWSCDR